MERYYTIEDIEILRSKSGISYEEAVNLLEYHNGNLAKALVDLEKNGKIGGRKTTGPDKESYQEIPYHGQNINSKKRNNFLTKLYRFRIIIRKKNMTIANLSLLYLIPTTVLCFWLIVPSLLLVLLLGYEISVDKNSPDFAKDSIEQLVKAGAQNVKETVNKFTSDENKNDFPYDSSENDNSPQDESYYNRKNTQTPPSNASPVTVSYQEEGEFSVKETEDGSQEITIQ